MRAAAHSPASHTRIQFLNVAEPTGQRGAFDFMPSDLAARMGDQAVSLRIDPRFRRLHRRLGGMYLLNSRISTRIEVGVLA